MSHTPILGLSDVHYEELATGSAISREVIRQRCYQSVTSDHLPEQFADYQRRAGLLIPIRGVNDAIVSFQLKPDQPRLDKHGKPIKYETAANAPQVIDVPASVQPLLGDPAVPLVITEGAKKVDSALSHGFRCVIGLQGVYGWRGKNDHGGKTALPDWEQIALNDRNILLAFDSDVMTKASVRDALDRLSGFLTGKGAHINYLLMPALGNGDKCGLDDWFASGKTRTMLQPYLAAQLPSRETPADLTPQLQLRYMHEVETRNVDWLWPNWLPKGMLTLLGGYAGDGKSTIASALAATLSTGGTLPDGVPAPITNTLLVLAEDDVSHVVKGRLEVHGADPHRVITLDSVASGDGRTRFLNLRTDVPLLQQAVEQHNIGLIVIDPLSSVLANGDRNNEGDVRDSLTPLVQMMETTGVAVIGIMHIGKNDGQARAMQKLMGSTAFTALARCVWMVQQLPDEFQHADTPTRKLLGVAKSNYAVAPLPLMFSRSLDAPLEFHGPSPVTIEQAFNWKSKSEGKETRSEADKAEEWLQEQIGDERVLASVITAAGKEAGFGETSLKVAKKRLGIVSVKANNCWYWSPAAAAEDVA